MAWQDKVNEARKLVEQVKSLNHEGADGASGIDTGTKAETARKMLDDANRLATEAKSERQTDEADRTEKLLAAFETGNTHVDADPTLQDRKTATIGRHKEQLVIAKSASHLYGSDQPTLKAANMKVLAEGANTTGGFLVVPEYHQEMFAEVRRTGNALRSLGWVNAHPTSSNTIKIPKGAGAATMAWVAENTPAPSQDQSFGQIDVGVFKAAGISKLSSELFEDSDPAAMDLAIRELGKLAAILEEQAWINGTGAGQPRGILNTAGVNATAVPVGSSTQQQQIDAVLDAASVVMTTYFAPATGVLVSPRRYAFWRKAKDTANNYLFNLPGSFRAPGEFSKSPSNGGDILGLPIGISANIPTNLGAGTNEDRFIVADWSEAHAFIRRDLTLSTSNEAGTAFANDEVHIRLTFRQGFTAERYPTAFAVGGGAGLV